MEAGFEQPAWGSDGSNASLRCKLDLIGVTPVGD